MQALGGCDSLVTTVLTVYPTTNRAESIYRCLGESYTVGGITYTSAVASTNIYTSHLQSWKGCDSTIVTTLTFDSRFRINATIRLCTGQTYTIPVPNGPTYTTSGTYTFETASTVGGCDTTRTTIVQLGRIVDTMQSVTICQGQSVTVGNHVYTTSGVYTDVFPSFGFACDSTMVTTVRVSEPKLQAQVSYTLCTGRNLGNILVTMTGGVAPYVYNWGAVSIPPVPFRACLEKGQYSVTVTDAAGCTVSEQINVYDDDYFNCLQMNEGISPDGDVHNETWQIPCIQDVENVVQLYNRWGQILFESKNYSGSFNGTIDGKPLPDGTYYYVVDTKARTYRGTLTILRQ
jgi:gliding motility-associated-like protein